MADADLHELIHGASGESLGRDKAGMRWQPHPAEPRDTHGPSGFHLVGRGDQLREVPCNCLPSRSRKRWFRR